ncbi:FixH family protein [Hydrogenimonas urashimensis]|uniref:FixH family protein n=1 Tax=Hydrogenimonas urashimensis TaxID=2740515 RepID=UPI0019166180|nr:FixH family protein [Hydrogenimonas urashimensis]
MQKSSQNQINYWPYAIVGMILTVVVLGIWTIKVAVNNPVQEERTYMMKYQDVDANINEILARQKAFESKYRVDLGMNRLRVGENRIKVAVADKAGNPLVGAKIFVIVTRPTTSKENIELKSFAVRDGIYVSEPFTIKRGGRWNIEVKIEIGTDIGFETYKTFVKI